MTIRAYFTNRKGAGCSRSVLTAKEAEKILKGGYNALEVTLRTDDDEVVGWRVKRDGRWLWSYDATYFEEAA